MEEEEQEGEGKSGRDEGREGGWEGGREEGREGKGRLKKEGKRKYEMIKEIFTYRGCGKLVPY